MFNNDDYDYIDDKVKVIYSYVMYRCRDDDDDDDIFVNFLNSLWIQFRIRTKFTKQKKTKTKMKINIPLRLRYISKLTFIYLCINLFFINIIMWKNIYK